MEWNAESVLDALNDFERKPEISPILNDYLKRVAKNGEIIFPWIKLKPLLKKKLDVVLDEFYETCPVEASVPMPNFETFNFDSLKKTILQAVDSFTSAPFTIQRLCELVIDPQKHYNRTDKYMRGIEKNVLVVSTIEPRNLAQADGNSNVNPVVNGLLGDSPRDDNDGLNGHESTDSVSSSNMNTPSNHVLLENFANVFPSAACIPSASNICINQEIDSNFMENTEDSIETQEVDFELTVPAEEPKSDTDIPKEEDMDTTEDEAVNDTVDGEVTSLGVSEPDNSDKPEPEVSKETETLEASSDTDKPMLDAASDIGVSETVENEADCSESSPEPPVISEAETNLEAVEKSNECQQDDTISQSDESSQSSTEVSQSNETSDETEAPPSEDIVDKVVTVSDSNTPKESAEESIKLESSTNSDEPPA